MGENINALYYINLVQYILLTTIKLLVNNYNLFTDCHEKLIICCHYNMILQILMPIVHVFKY